MAKSLRWLVVLVGMFWACTAFAQSADHVEIFGGYSYSSGDFTGGALIGNGALTRGWNASVNLKFKPKVGLVSDFAGYYEHLGFCSCGSSAYTFMFGPQFSFPLTKVTPYVHVLLGAAHAVQSESFSAFVSNNSIAVAWGGGLDYHLTRHFALRGQADFLATRFTSGDNQDPFRHNFNARISAGLVLRF